MTPSNTEIYEQADQILRASKRNIAFTGAGISVESGIPPFRGEGGLWSKHNPIFLDIEYFHKYPRDSWKKIKEIFYDFFGKAAPNEAHRKLADLESRGWLDGIITQNIDNLHQAAGSQSVIEFHGSSQTLICTRCGAHQQASSVDLENLPPRCKDCDGVLKPDFVFFGEPIPKDAHENSFAEVERAGSFLIIGTTGEIMPASIIPIVAKSNGVKIIEINIKPSKYTNDITDVFIQEKASIAMGALSEILSSTR